MGLHTTFTALAEVIDAYESRGRSIKTVEASPADTGDAVLDVTVAMPVSLRSGGGADEGLTPETASLTDSGDLEVTFSPAATELPSTAGASLSTGDASATVTDDGLLLTVDLTIDATGAPDEAASVDCGPDQASPADATTVRAVNSSGTDGGTSLADSAISDAESVSEGGDGTRESPQSDGAATAAPQSGGENDSESGPFAAVRDDSVPPYEDTDYLQALYDECDNFREIAEQIQMDVSSETVRRYMIEADIHVPNTYNTSSDEEEEAAESGSLTTARARVKSMPGADRSVWPNPFRPSQLVPRVRSENSPMSNWSPTGSDSQPMSNCVTSRTRSSIPTRCTRSSDA